jgi:hypothetical protein
VFSSAQAGAVVCLSAGNYGSWAGGAKSGTVTIRGADGGGSSINLNLGSANNLNIQNMTVTGGQINGSSKNITVANSNFTGLFLIETSTANANIVMDTNRHVNLDAPPTGLPARITIWSSGKPSGVTVKNSYFSGGDADGVRPDADQVQILNNEFADLVDKGVNHTDPIQLYGGTRAVIRGNYFHQANGGNISAYIMQADGGTGNVIENNVFGAVNGGANSGHGVGYGITLLSDNGSVIRHNTFQKGVCDFNIPCGTLYLGNKSGDPVSKGTVIQDNVVGSISGGNGTFTSDHNVWTSSSPGGTGDQKATPTYVGPLTTWAGYKLASGSPGLTTASDGGAVGIR